LVSREDESHAVVHQKISRIVQTILFIYLMEYFEDGSTVSDLAAYLYAGGMAFLYFFQAVIASNIVHYFMQCGMQWQSGTAGLLYQKVLKTGKHHKMHWSLSFCMPQALRVSNSAMSTTTSGYIIDLIAHDAEKLDWVIWQLHSVWVTPMHALIIFTIIYLQIGPSVFSSLAIMLCMWPMQIIFARMIAHYRYNSGWLCLHSSGANVLLL
jgi:ATP-binding cassette subfamily C (CFTR/MRP) protein 4